MRITFFSNYLNHHQLPFCLEMYNLLGDDFKFVAIMPTPQARLKMGYSDISEIYPFALNAYTSKENFIKGINLGYESDAVIIGSSYEIFIEKRLKENKLTFRYSERIFKKGQWRVWSPRALYSLYQLHTKYRNNNLYMLCASAYTACDFNLVGAYKNKRFKWGYFPEVKKFTVDELMLKKKNSVSKLLWVGRFIDWKHPEHALIVAKLLKKKGYDFTLDMIGTGVMEEHLQMLIKNYDLEDKVNIMGGMTPEEVRRYMEASNIYLFTSDFNEGWGAVLNESMSSGCAVVASHAIGAVPFLIKNQENGLIYKNGNVKQLFECIKRLIEDSELCEQLGKSAYKTVLDTWNAKIAAERFLKLTESLITGQKVIYEDGPCSIAESIRQSAMYEYITRK